MSKQSLSRFTLNRLRRILWDLKHRAMVVGRYPCTLPAAYDERVKSQAFKCIAYNELVSQIQGLENAIAVLSTVNTPAVKTANRP